MLKLGLALALFFSLPAWANLLPPNQPIPQLEEREANGITQEEFNQIIDQIEKIYDPLMDQQGGRLQINRLWNSNAINATSTQNHGQWIISIYGGIARHPLITADALAMVVCHEVGHHLAGFPQMSSWAATEGNADYFASQTCLKKLWQGQPAQAISNGAEGISKQLCDEVYGPNQTPNRRLCDRQLAAAYSLGSLLALLENQNIDWTTPDLSRVSSTLLVYPAPQCRFDTLIAASLCTRSFDESLIPWNEKEMAASSCHAVNGDSRGLRPLCWFFPRLGK